MSQDPSVGLRQHLVAQLRQTNVLTSPDIEAAFLAVPRHLFLPSFELEQVYQDIVIPIKFQGETAISSSSQPSMMAIMLEQLALQPGQRVLEIGAGTGYNAALMAHVVGSHGSVVTVDLDQDLVDTARANLHRAGFDRVQTVCADGAHGYAEGAPYDRIILTVGAWDVLPAWYQQLAPGGRLLLPLTVMPYLMLSVALEVRGDLLESISTSYCGFMPLRGVAAHPQVWNTGSARVRVHPHEHRQHVTQIETHLDREWAQLDVVWPIGAQP
jgi:protein-L-isoaspartate(D-aspartate) O-methyltransferase